MNDMQFWPASDKYILYRDFYIGNSVFAIDRIRDENKENDTENRFVAITSTVCRE